MGNWTFEAVPGYFLTDQPCRPAAISANFGLLPSHSWSTLLADLAWLNSTAPNHTKYKLLFAARHGEGYHNIAESKFGTLLWDTKYSLESGDWGPDPRLTPLGESQALAVRAGWPADAPRPRRGSRYVSPLSRALHTLQLSNPTGEGVMGAKVKEGLREVNGVHTCDKRRSRSEIERDFDGVVFEHGFREEDDLWSPDVRETDESVQRRVGGVLCDIWENDEEHVVGITSHSGVMRALFAVTGHAKVEPPTGAIIPLIVKGTLE